MNEQEDEDDERHRWLSGKRKKIVVGRRLSVKGRVDASGRRPTPGRRQARNQDSGLGLACPGAVGHTLYAKFVLILVGGLVLRYVIVWGGDMKAPLAFPPSVWPVPGVPTLPPLAGLGG